MESGLERAVHSCGLPWFALLTSERVRQSCAAERAGLRKGLPQRISRRKALELTAAQLQPSKDHTARWTAVLTSTA